MNNIKDFDQYLKEKYFKLSEKDKEYLLELDRKYGELAIIFRKEFKAKNVMNLDSEFEKFIEHKRVGKKYFPKLDLEKIQSSIDIKAEFEELLAKFENFSSFISKFYIERINGFLKTFRLKEKYEEMTESGEYGEKSMKKNNRSDCFPSLAEYNYALEIIKDFPYETIKGGVRDIKAEDAVKLFQKKIDELGYEYKVKLVDGMLPRVNVTPEGIVRVNPKATFSMTDIEGLYQHELYGHVGRRYYGYQTGLNLFVIGLSKSNTYDEGLAIWNSINKVKTPKPNILFNIAIKTIIAYHSYDMDFCELFDFIHELVPNMSDKTIFKSVVRNKRNIGDCRIISGAIETGYLKGYKLVTLMSDEEREDILKYNIGPDQMGDLNNIKVFLEVNEFKPLKIKVKDEQ
jgi:hypothetical protein